jgi:hypothetical protein
MIQSIQYTPSLTHFKNYFYLHHNISSAKRTGVCCKPPEDMAFIQGSLSKSSSRQIRQRLKPPSLTVQTDVLMADGEDRD